MDLRSDPLLKNLPDVRGYKVLKPAVLYAKIGQGGMGAVYRGRHLNLEVDVAVKCLKSSLASEDEQFIVRFQNEAKFAASIHHENLIHVYDVAHEAGVHYLVMEYVAGETARQRVRRKGPLAQREAATILLGAARGLAAAHKKRIVHRDIKPDNILIGSDGSIKVADLGIARALERHDLTTLTTGTIGTPQYMPPEQWLDSKKVSQATDVWSLGATLYFMLAGDNAIQATTQGECALKICNEEFPDITAVRPEIDPGLRELLRRMTAREPEGRPQVAQDVVRELTLWLGEHQVDLADAEAGSSPADALVSPPPAKTLAQIRIEISTQTGPKVDHMAPTVAHQAAQPGLGSDSGPTIATSRSSSRRPLIVAAVALFVVAGAYGVYAVTRPSTTAVKGGSGAQGAAVRVVDPKFTSDGVQPGAELWTQRPRYTLAGQLAGGDGVTLQLVNGSDLEPFSIDGFGRATATIELRADERNDLRVVWAKGQLFQLTVVQDSKKPVIQLLAPLPRDNTTRVNRTSISVAARVTDASIASVLCQGREGVRDGERFEFHGIELARDQQNRVQIVATDQASNTETSAFVVVVDDVAPRIVASDKDGQTLTAGAPQDVEFVFDEVVAKYTHGGKSVALGADRARVRIDVPDDAPEFTVELVLEDELGNATPRAHSLRSTMRSSQPVIVITEPVTSEKSLRQHSFGLVGRVASPSKAPLIVERRLGEREFDALNFGLSSDGSFDHDVSLPEDGVYVLTVRHGDAASLQFVVVRDTRAPVITAEDRRTQERSIDYRFRVEELHVERVELNGRRALEEDGEFVVRGLALEREGRNPILIEAVDQVGLRASQSITIILDRTGPQPLAVNPPEGSVLEGGRTQTIHVTFDEDVVAASAVNQTSPAQVGGRAVAFSIAVPADVASVGLDYEVRDDLKNVTTKALRFAVRTESAVQPPPPPPPPVFRLPDAFAEVGNDVDELRRPKLIRHKETGIHLVLVPGGSFQMGSATGDEDERPVHSVTVAPFYLGVTEVSIGQWKTIAKHHKTEAEEKRIGQDWDFGRSMAWARENKASWKSPMPRLRALRVTDELPATQVTFRDALAFCDFYGLRLPTEVQWEYAHRAGTTSEFAHASDASALDFVNYADLSFAKQVGATKTDIYFQFEDRYSALAPVGVFRPNAFGLKGTGGNVWEWCSDVYDATLYARRATNPSAAPVELPGERHRVLRGASWRDEPEHCRSANRKRALESGYARADVGFRVAWNPER